MTPADAAAQVMEGFNESLWLFVYDKMGRHPENQNEALKVIEGMNAEERECYMVDKEESSHAEAPGC